MELYHFPDYLFPWLIGISFSLKWGLTNIILIEHNEYVIPTLFLVSIYFLDDLQQRNENDIFLHCFCSFFPCVNSMLGGTFHEAEIGKVLFPIMPMNWYPPS